ncbi:hypothetical protein BC628DRAFT_1340220 [Trametes gibbosa]|nr:hypothetical protein BC628DRAFT_1340220 [Trametes gibbosa]
MFSPSSAARALLVAALCSPVLSVPHLSARHVKRALQEYVDHLVYVDSSKSALYAAVEIDGQTFGASLDNHCVRRGGLVVKDNTSSQTSSLTVGPVSFSAAKVHGTVGFLQEDIEIDYYSTSYWPKSWPAVNSTSDIGAARVGIDITDSKSVINQYLAATSKGKDSWFYDLLLFYDWQDSSYSATEIDFAGIVTTGSPLDWTSVFGISSSDVSKYGLPDLSSVKQQPYIYLRNDGTMYVDNTIWANGNQVSASSHVPKTPSGMVVAEVDLTMRFSTFPDAVVKALYGSLPGAKYYGHSKYGYWQVPCDSQVSFWFTIGGTKYNVNAEALLAPNPWSWGSQCVGTLFTSGHATPSTNWDIVLGFQFISSFYYRTGITSSGNQPYVQMLPLPSGGWSYGDWSGSASAGAPWPASTGTAGSNNNGGNQGATSTKNAGAASMANVYSTYTPQHTSYAGSGWSSAQGSKGQSQRSTSTIFTTTTRTIIGTTTVAGPPPSSTGGYSGSGSGSDAGSYSGSGYSGSGSGSGSNAENLAAVGNVAETDSDGNDLNLPHGGIADRLKHCLPAIIVIAAIAGLGLIGGLIACLVRRRRSSVGGSGPSAYKNLHDADVHAPVHVPLYGAEEGHTRYSDPYKDQE